MSKKRKIIYPLLFIILLTATSPLTHAFSDLPETNHYYYEITYLHQEGIIDGYPDGTVKPNGQINRAELVKMLVEGLGYVPNPENYINCFPDVHEEWFAPYVCFAQEQKWIQGYPDGTFKPSQQVNKVEALKIILNAYNIIPTISQTTPFNDTATNDWYSPFINTAVQKNLIEESSGYFNPTYFRSRGEIALMIARIIQINYMNDPVYTNWIGTEFQTFMLLNQLREENGVTEKLILNPQLTKVAREHSKDMAEVIGDMSHEGSDGSQSWDRIRDEIEYEGRAGENVGKGYISSTNTPFDAVKYVHDNIFMVEPDTCHNHKTTILSSCLNFTEVGIGVYVKDNYTYFTEDFISREEQQ